MITVAKYQYEANALFVYHRLKEMDIKPSLNEVKKGDEVFYEISVIEEVVEEAKNAIKNMNIDDEAIDTEAEGYIDRLQEWQNNRYYPGYYTGGKIPHYMLDKSNWKFFAPVYLLIGIFLAFAFFYNGFNNISFVEIAITSLYLFVGASLLWQLKSKKKK